MNDNILDVCVDDCLDSIDTSSTLQERLEQAMGRVATFFMSTDETLRVQGAVMAVISSYPDHAPERRRLEREWDYTVKLTQFLASVSPEYPKWHGEPLIILPTWVRLNEAQKAKDAR